MTASRIVRAGAMAALVLAVVWVLWPRTMGGGTTYLSTYGNSMEPGFSADDLAILRAADSYGTGDVVAYRSGSLNTVVMHRIVSGDAAGFVTQGDNNDWLDEDRPTEEEILGRLVLRIPQGGKVIDAMGAPGLLLPAAGTVLAVLGAARKPLRRRRGRAARHRAPAFSPSTRSLARQTAVGAAAVVVLATVACCALLVVPATQTGARTVEVSQHGQFSYSGRAEPGTTYPTGVIETGDTVWTRLADDLTVSYSGTVSAPGLTGLTGELRLDVVVAAADGWSAVLASGAAARFEGGTATATVGIDAAAAVALVQRHYTEVGASGSQATVTVTPVAAATGTVEGRTVTAEALEGLDFTLDAMALRPAGDLAAALTPGLGTSVTIEETVPRTFDLLALSVPFDVAQRLAGGLLLAGLAVLGVGALIGRTGRGDVADRFLVRHADRILPVTAFDPGPAVVDVSDAESLHRVAERFDTVVLHHAAPDGDVFAVRDSEMTYRFVVPGLPARPRGKPPVPSPDGIPAGGASVRPPAPASLPAPVAPWGSLA